MKPIHSLPLLASLALVAGPGQAAPSEYCQSQARELAMKAGNDIFPEMNATQRGRLQQLAAEICASYAGKSPSPPPQDTAEADTPAVADAESEEDEDGNWLTRMLTPPEDKFADDPPNRPERGRLHQ